MSVPDPDDYLNFDQGWNRGALAWETGTAPMSLIHGFKASLELLSGLGVDKVANYLEELTDYLCERLEGKPYEIVSSRAPGEKSQIVCIRHRAGLSAMTLYAHLMQRKIVTAPRNDRLRISPHLYNTSQEIDELVKALP